jgi:hypothetical protein
MKKLHERCAGLDVHRDTVAACVHVPGHSEVRTISLILATGADD